MHEVGALFFLYAFPFPSIFRTPLSQKRRTQNTRILFKVVRYSVSLQINKGALKALAPKSLKPAGTPCTALYCPKSPDVDIQPDVGQWAGLCAAICETPCCYALGRALQMQESTAMFCFHKSFTNHVLILNAIEYTQQCNRQFQSSSLNSNLYSLKQTNSSLKSSYLLTYRIELQFVLSICVKMCLP